MGSTVNGMPFLYWSFIMQNTQLKLLHLGYATWNILNILASPWKINNHEPQQMLKT